MNENLNKRKADFIKYLDEELADKPRKWWQQKTNEYIPTRDMGGGKNSCPHNPEETIVKYDFKGALTSSALFLCIMPAFYFLTGEWKRSGFPDSFWPMLLFMLVAMVFPLMQNDKKGTLILYNQQGFWTRSMPELVTWDKLVASFIREDNSGESTSNYLLLYYYDKMKDEFVKMEYNVDGLDMKKEDIASQLEYWKMIAGVDTITM
jgi:hypothetical protein